MKALNKCCDLDPVIHFHNAFKKKQVLALEMEDLYPYKIEKQEWPWTGYWIIPPQDGEWVYKSKKGGRTSQRISKENIIEGFVKGDIILGGDKNKFRLKKLER